MEVQSKEDQWNKRFITVQVYWKIKKCYTISSLFNTQAIFFLEFLILSTMYTQLAGDVTWWESLLLSRTKLSYFGEHSDVSQVRSLHVHVLNKNAVSCYDRLETIINRKTPKAQTQPKSEKF